MFEFLSYLIMISPFTGSNEIFWFKENDNTFNVETIIFHKGTIKQNNSKNNNHHQAKIHGFLNICVLQFIAT